MTRAKRLLQGSSIVQSRLMPGGVSHALSFGLWLKEARKRRRLSQERLGRAVGCTGSYISLLESAKPDRRSGVPLRPSFEMVDAVAAALGVTRREARLAAGYVSTDDAQMSENELRLLEAYRALPPGAREIVEMQIEALRQHFTRD